MTQVAVGITVGVAVEAGVKVGVCEANVIEERGVSVHIGEAIAAGCINVMGVPPQAVKRKINPTVSTKIFFIDFLKRVIEIPENSQAVECEPGRNDLNNISFLGNPLLAPRQWQSLSCRVGVLCENVRPCLRPC